jgi:beta-phosphoglucomutase
VNRREFIRYQLLVPTAVNLAAGALLVLAGLAIASRASIPWWAPTTIIGVGLLATIALTRTRIALRFLSLRVLQEVSSSKCSERFLSLALLGFTRFRDQRRIMTTLSDLAAIRKYPVLRFLVDLEALLRGDAPSDESATAAVGKYLRRCITQRQALRLSARQELASYLAQLPTETYLVLYGYSSIICETLSESALPRLPIFLIQELQYGVEGTRGEHAITLALLRKAGIEPIVVPFSEVGDLLDGGVNFVTTSDRRTVPLAKSRQIIGLSGCEALSIDGEILITSRVHGIPSETAKFAEVFEQAATGSVPAELVVVGESYKVYEGFGASDLVSHAPLKKGWLRTPRYLMLSSRGLAKRMTEVELVRLGPPSVRRVIDDTGIHPLGDGGTDLHRSLAAWAKSTMPYVRRLPSPQVGAILAGKRVAIFDLSGVIIDDEPARYAAFADLTRESGESLSYDEYVRFCSGRSDGEAIANLVEHRKVVGEPQALLARKQARHERRAPETPVGFPGIATFVSKLAADHVMCFVVAASDAMTVDRALRAAAVETSFPANRRIVDVNAADLRAAYESVVRLAGAPPNACVLLDDSPEHVTIARAVGMATIGVATTTRPDDFAADVVVDSPVSLLGNGDKR